MLVVRAGPFKLGVNCSIDMTVAALKALYDSITPRRPLPVHREGAALLWCSRAELRKDGTELWVLVENR